MLRQIEKSLSSALQKDVTLHMRYNRQEIDTTGTVIDEEGNKYFCKVSKDKHTLDCEVYGLQLLRETQTIRVPNVICEDSFETTFFVVFEHFSFKHESKKGYYEMGKKLAQLHRSCSPNGKYGLDSDNYIGDTVQHNTWTANWADFYVKNRLHPQIELFIANGHKFENQEEFESHIYAKLKDHHPSASLLHGDLWGGNAAFIESSVPVIYDPAVYYGDRETDVIMTQTFGDFPDSFYQGYNEEWPLPDNYLSRRHIYDLYHILNHANIYGGGYVDVVYEMVKDIIDE